MLAYWLIVAAGWSLNFVAGLEVHGVGLSLWQAQGRLPKPGLAIILEPWRSTGAVACRATAISWRAGERLSISDFRGPVGQRGLSAEASTGISIKSTGNMAEPTFRVAISSYFEPCDSWMREQERNAYTLAHEQVHFDITELFARRLARRYVAEINSNAEFQRRYSRIYEEVWGESRQLQERYDEEVYGDGAAQTRWIEEIAARLSREPAMVGGGIELPMR